MMTIASAHRFKNLLRLAVGSMPEVAHSGEYHGDPAFVGGSDHFGVTHTAPRLDHRDGAVVGNHIESVAKRKKGIGCSDRPRERQTSSSGLDRSDPGGIYPAHLSGANPQRLPAATINDGVGFDESRYAPCEGEIRELLSRRRFARDHLEGRSFEVIR